MDTSVYVVYDKHIITNWQTKEKILYLSQISAFAVIGYYQIQLEFFG